MTPWPRKLVNYPIIVIAIVQQYLWAATIAVNAGAMHTTGVSIFTKIFPPGLYTQQGPVVMALALVATMSALSFNMPRRIGTLLMLLPQQLMLFISAGGAAEAIYKAQFADGVERSHAFLLVDQVPLILVAIFHTWAIILIARYSED